MSSVDCESNVAKEEKTGELASEAVNIEFGKPAMPGIVVDTVTETTADAKSATEEKIETKSIAPDVAAMPAITTAATEASVATEVRPGFMATQFRQKARVVRDAWAQHHKLMKFDREHTQLIIIILLSLIAIICSITALVTNGWTCNSNSRMYFGLWNTCYRQVDTVTNSTAFLKPPLNSNVTNITSWQTETEGTVCAHQSLYDVRVVYAEQSRIDQVSAAQGLIVCGAFLYVLSLLTIALAFKFIHTNNLNCVRNALVTSMCVQITSFLMQLIGFFLFILTDRLSISIALLFVYFGLAIFATNTINFITIEYKAFKTRHMAM